MNDNLIDWAAAQEREKKGRKPAWAQKIEAPPEALEFYRAVQKLQQSTAFSTCHVYHGAKIGTVPYVSFDNKLIGLPHLVLAFLGLTPGRKVCGTVGCCNPFHYTAPPPPLPQTLPGLVSPPPPPLPPPIELNDYLEMVEYYVDKLDTKNFDLLREAIPATDISDEILNLVIEKLSS